MTNSSITPSQWLKLYDKNFDKFEWFISKDLKKELSRARDNKDIGMMMSLLTGIWFALPDNRFNIIENPEGWEEFLAVIDNPPKRPKQ